MNNLKKEMEKDLEKLNKKLIQHQRHQENAFKVNNDGAALFFKWEIGKLKKKMEKLENWLKYFENDTLVEVGKKYKLKEGGGICLWEKNENKLDLLNIISIEYTVTEKYKNWFEIDYVTLSFKCKQDNQHTIQVDLFTFKSMFEEVK